MSQKAQQTYDVCVIGAGPGGYVAAIRSAQLGLKTCIVEREWLGGVCLNVGCIPSKAMITAAHFLEKMQSHAPKMGFQVPDSIDVDMKQLKSWKQSVSDKMSGGVKQLLKGNKIDIVMGEASFSSPNELSVQTKDGGQSIQAKNYVIATGSRPITIPSFEADENTVLTSTGALELEKVPQSLVVIGGGYIGLEIGSYLNGLGSEVTVIEATDGLLKGMADPEAVQVVAKKLKKKGVKVELNAKAKRYQKGSKGQNLNLFYEKDGQEHEISCEKILVTVGRKPNSDQMGLRELGLKIDAQGFLEVNSFRKTNLPHIYAIGDIACQPMLAHKASHEGVLVAERIAGHNRVYDAKTVPSVIFVDPEIASAGWSEEECKSHGYTNLKIGKFPFAANGRAVSMQETDGFVKIIAEERTHVVLGVHIVGPEASNLISEAALAIEMGATLEDLALTIHPHPTLGETMMEAAEATLGHAIHVIQKPLSRTQSQSRARPQGAVSPQK